jgi:hypothetical protein
MEQDRASAVCMDQPELAREATGELCDNPETDRSDQDGGGFESGVPTGHEQLPGGTQGD